MVIKSLILLPIMFFNSCFLFAQNVGIGTPTPTGKLQINHASTNVRPGILLQDSTSTRTGLIRFTNVSSPKYIQLWGFYDNLFSAGQYLDISSDSTFIATFRGNGSVGIGVLDPVYRLDVNGVINSASEYRLNGKTVFRWNSFVAGLYRNFSAGDSAGSFSSGSNNTFIGGAAGYSNIGGSGNSFLGTIAGYKNIAGDDNTFIGYGAGYNSIGSQNTFVGRVSGFHNETGNHNLFVGETAGWDNIDGSQNTFLGAGAGSSNLSGGQNVFVGNGAGYINTTGDNNTTIGFNSNLGSGTLINATAIGHKAYVTQSNSLVLGSINGVNLATADTRVGVGTTAPSERLDIVGNIKVSGEINNPSTGTANLLPIAYGGVSPTGTILSGSGNFTVSRTGAGSYTIDISGHSYGFSTYTAVVTAIAGPFVTSTTSASGNLLVRLYNLSSVLTDGNFHFVVYKQ